MQSEQVFELLKSRRSIRKFTDQPVTDEQVETILEAGSWAPSGANNQPWRFVVVRQPEVQARVAEQCKYSKMLLSAQVLLPVFIHKPSMYNPTKDHQSVGACLENMLLMAHGLGLGAVWVGQILANAEEVRQLLGLGEDYELMAVIALGWPAVKGASSRLPLEELVLKRL